MDEIILLQARKLSVVLLFDQPECFQGICVQVPYFYDADSEDVWLRLQLPYDFDKKIRWHFKTFLTYHKSPILMPSRMNPD
jgi:hypothetical protein